MQMEFVCWRTSKTGSFIDSRESVGRNYVLNGLYPAVHPYYSLICCDFRRSCFRGHYSA